MSVLYSDSARFNQRTNNLTAIGNVIVVSDSGFTLSSHTITWDNQYKLIHTEEHVMFTTTTLDTMYGIGFESDMDLSQWKIKKPSGVIRKDL
jgi:lipopolysaccharide assembly outer membrane protein LptD (OstA)